MMQEFTDPSTLGLPTVKVSNETVERGSCLRLCGLTMGGFFARTSPANRYETSDYDVLGSSNQANDERPVKSLSTAIPISLPKAHHESVSCVEAVRPGICLSGSNDNTLALYDFEAGKLVSRWSGHSKGVTCCAHHKDYYFSGCRDTLAYLWSYEEKCESGKPIRTYTGHTLLISALQTNSDGKVLLTGSRDNSMKMWDVERGEMQREQKISRNLVTDLKWVSLENMIIQTSEDKQVRLWDSRSLSVIHSFGGKQYIQTCCDITDDGRYGLTASNGFMLGQGCDATLWDIRGRGVLHQLIGHEQSINCCSFLPSSLITTDRLLVTAGNDSTVRIWDQGTGKCVAQIYLVGAGPINSVTCFEDGNICVGTFNLGIQVLFFNVQEMSLVQKALY